MTGFEIFGIYLGIKAHFQKSYDYSRYGPVNAKRQTYNQRRDRYFFEKLSKKLNDCDVVNFFVANFMHDETRWIGDMLDEQSLSVYKAWQTRYESMDYRYKQDVHTICEHLEANRLKFNDLFECEKGARHPLIFQFAIQGKITPESFIILNDILQFLPAFDRHLGHDPTYQAMSLKYKKYRCFFPTLNRSAYRKVLRDELEFMSLV
jgi:hypothetical protein